MSGLVDGFSTATSRTSRTNTVSEPRLGGTVASRCFGNKRCVFIKKTANSGRPIIYMKK